MESAITHPPKSRLVLGEAGLWLFIASEAMLFLALVAARFYLAGLDRPAGLNEGLGLALTGDLLLSSFLAYRAEKALAQGNRSAFLGQLLGTLMLGALFVLGVALEWSTVEFPIGTAFGTAFFTTTGLHVVHLVSGLVVLVLVYRLGRRGHFSANDHWGVTAAIRYWTFVDAMWVLIVWPMLYLL
jgi:heme/copper-type cytochrome/quinol oxidase subunit 3